MQQGPTRAFQLTTTQDNRLLSECEQQTYYAKKGICPPIYDIVDYTSKGKEKRAIFVEPFDNDLQVFDPGQPEKVAGEDPRPFALRDDQIFTIFKTLCRYLDVLHSENIAHRDVCLENVGLSYEVAKEHIHTIYLTDYGTVVNLEDKCYLPLQWYGHTEYTAPEYFRKIPFRDEKAADIYAVGVLLSMLMAGQSETLEEWEPGWVFDLIEMKQSLTEETDFSEILAQQESYQIEAPSHPTTTREFMLTLLGSCLDPNPERRPRAQELLNRCNQWEALLRDGGIE